MTITQFLHLWHMENRIGQSAIGDMCRNLKDMGCKEFGAPNEHESKAVADARVLHEGKKPAPLPPRAFSRPAPAPVTEGSSAGSGVDSEE